MKPEHPVHWYKRSRDADPEAIATRLAETESYVYKRVEAIQTRIDPHRHEINRQLNRILHENMSTRSRIRALWAVADLIGSFAGESVACTRGCTHCCHIAVGVPKAEAEVIGESIGRKPANARARLTYSDVEWGYHNPCTFLKDGDCSIYEHRPLACRAHFSLDVDDLLCRLAPPRNNKVPFFDTRMLIELLVAITNAGKPPHCADIREWFPIDGEPV